MITPILALLTVIAISNRTRYPGSQNRTASNQDIKKFAESPYLTSRFRHNPEIVKIKNDFFIFRLSKVMLINRAASAIFVGRRCDWWFDLHRVSKSEPLVSDKHA
ncbi:hypothetical protein AVEN_166791-1 [Araneus ventricosus]|uniref:FHA domain-containing protein n=1 Tax=Araneus ventricosus TaxID=182803 RepID=A0A4Y2BRD1_ARAVE|nr:hypothetical protein AVEN_166791-1 [Araneus ventricosus]